MFHRRAALRTLQVNALAARVAADAILADSEQQALAGAAAALPIAAGWISIAPIEHAALAGPRPDLARSTPWAGDDRQHFLDEIAQELAFLNGVPALPQCAHER